jgi:hypothetical protein
MLVEPALDREGTVMTTDPGRARQEDPYRTEAAQTGWYGFIGFAGIMLCVLGAFHAVMGLVGLFEEDYYAVGDSGLLVSVNYNTWGWVHLLFGILAICAGVALTSGATWARITAVAIAVISAMLNLAFMSAYPLWSVIMIAIDFLVIYAVTVHGDPASLEGY